MFGGFTKRIVNDLEEASSLRSLSEVMLTAANELGFEYYSIAQSNSSRTDIGPLLALNYPESFMRQQAETMTYQFSPVLLAVNRSSAPFLWSDLPKLIDFKETHRTYLNEAAAHGLCEGFTIPVHQPGEPSGFVSFVKSDKCPPDAEILPTAYFVGAHAFAAGRRIRDLNLVGSAEQLSENDRKVIKFVGRGKSKLFISRKLDMTQAQVAESLNRTRRYYRVGSHTEAVVQALWDRSIRFEDVIG